MPSYVFKNEGYERYIVIKRELTVDEQKLLGEILTFFPHCGELTWRNKFSQENFAYYSKELLAIAANAYDGNGNTMLGVASEYGKDANAIQRLIDFGADLNAPDHNMRKLALHWAVCNKLSYCDKESYEAVEAVRCLLANGARTDITCYQNTTPFEYAKSRGYTAAASLIKAKEEAYIRGPSVGLLRDFLPPEIAGHISSFFNIRECARLSRVRVSANNTSKVEFAESVIAMRNAKKNEDITDVEVEESLKMHL
ncbi:MAG: ankyrin repeat domain-containing protein [Legionella sp.]|nr:ankyrin repeat domain-containing protein [Legionella sp.]